MAFYSKQSKSSANFFSLTLDLQDNLPILSADDDFYEFIEYTKEDFISTFDNRFLFLLHPFDIIHLNDLIFDENSFDGQKISVNCSIITKSQKTKFIRLIITYKNSDVHNRVLQVTLFDVSSDVKFLTMPSLLEDYFSFLDKLTNNYYFSIDIATGTFSSVKQLSSLIGMPATFHFPNDLLEKEMISSVDADAILNRAFEENTIYFSETQIKTKEETKIFLTRYKVVFANNKPVHILGKFTDITNKPFDLNIIPNDVKFDNLTLLYNKNISYDLIRNALINKKSEEVSALILIDLKNFRSINEKFGTVYGDAILSEYANLLKQTFRNIDIVSRIGGDDFLVFMQDCHSQDLILQKIDKIHKFFSNQQELNSEGEFEVFAEIGIAVSSENSTFKTLLHKAGLALEQTKVSSSPDSYFTILTDDLSGKSFKSPLSKINEHNSAQQNFNENMIAYVFNLLYNAADFESAIQSVLHLITDHYKFSSSFITEFSDDSRFLNINHSWIYNDSISHLLENSAVTDFLFLTVPIINSGSIFLDASEESDEVILELLNSNSVNSLISYALVDDGKAIGFVTFTSQEPLKSFSLKELDKLSGAAKVISIFLSKFNAKTKNYKNFLDDIKS